jgi:hypothetical protein
VRDGLGRFERDGCGLSTLDDFLNFHSHPHELVGARTRWEASVMVLQEHRTSDITVYDDIRDGVFEAAESDGGHAARR